MQIVGTSVNSCEKAMDWARLKGATDVHIGLAAFYWSLAPATTVSAEIAYCQASKETGFGHFGGVIDASYNNPCGLKNHNGGSNDDPNAHHRFSSWQEGIQAHLDHLALYAGVAGYPRMGSPDPRAFSSVYGAATTVESLGGHWAPSPTYGTDIVTLVADLSGFLPLRDRIQKALEILNSLIA